MNRDRGAMNGIPRTILVVEDERIVARDLQSRLKRLGYSVPAIACSGEEAIAKADPSFIEVKGFKIPYAVFENEPEKTLDPSLIGNELERCIARLAPHLR